MKEIIELNWTSLLSNYFIHTFKCSYFIKYTVLILNLVFMPKPFSKNKIQCGFFYIYFGKQDKILNKYTLPVVQIG